MIFISPVSSERRILCRIKRYKDGLNRLNPYYEMYLEEANGTRLFLLSAKKQGKTKTSAYIISTKRLVNVKDQKEGMVGKVR